MGKHPHVWCQKCDRSEVSGAPYTSPRRGRKRMRSAKSS